MFVMIIIIYKEKVWRSLNARLFLRLPRPEASVLQLKP